MAIQSLQNILSNKSHANELEVLRTHSVDRYDHYIRWQRIKNIGEWAFLVCAAVAMFGGFFWLVNL